MPDSFDPYRVLGLPIGASRKEIQKRYRQLLRIHHPDVAEDPERAHESAAEIGRAYRALMDDARRERYEENLFQGVDADLQVVVEQADPARSPVADLLARAREHLRRGQPEEAQLVCSEILAYDPDCAEAYEITARAYEARGLADLAREMYREAERLGRVGSAPYRQANTAAPRPSSEPRPVGPTATWEPEPVRVRHWLELSGTIAAAALLWLALRQQGGSAGLLGAPWGGAVLVAAAAYVYGLGIAASGRLATLDQELGQSLGDRGNNVPLWLLVAVALVVLAPVGVAAHLVANLLAERSLRSFALLWGGVVGLIVAYMGLGGIGWGFLWLGGDLVSVAALLGWFQGSIFSPREWWREERTD